jgi:predicted transcriptional regulator
MSVKEQILASLRELPEDASWEDASERILFLAALDEGSRQIDAGLGLTHDAVKLQVLSWSKK